MTQIVVLHYPAERARNWVLLKAAARERDLRLVSWAPHLLGLWCADGQQSACYAGRPARPGIVIHRTVAPFRGIAAPVLACLAAQGSLVLNHPDAAFRSRDKLLTTLDLAGAGIPVVPTAAFDEPGGANLAALGQGELIVKPARGVRGEGITTYRSAAALTAAWQPREPWRPGAARPGYHAEREHYLAQPLIGGGGQDVRAYVVGEQCVALMRRVARPGEVRANLALGGDRCRPPAEPRRRGRGGGRAGRLRAGLRRGGPDRGRRRRRPCPGGGRVGGLRRDQHGHRG